MKRLEELGIGRPSTYASTIDVMQKRGYVVKEDRDGTPRDYRVLTLAGSAVQAETATENAGQERGKLFPTDIGLVVNDFLLEHFQNILDYNFTADVEGEFDVIARGQLDWRHAQALLRPVQGNRGHHNGACRACFRGAFLAYTPSRVLKSVPHRTVWSHGQIGGPDDEDKQYASSFPANRSKR